MSSASDMDANNTTFVPEEKDSHNDMTENDKNKILEDQEFLEKLTFDVLNGLEINNSTILLYYIEKLQDKIREQNKNYENLQSKMKELEKEKETLENSPKVKENVSKIISSIFQEMKTICIWNRNKTATTEYFYNYLLFYVNHVECYIPGFASSWRAYRRDFDGMFGLVKAANRLMECFNSQSSNSNPSKNG